MRTWVLQLLVVSLLVTSMEGAAEPVDDTTFHQSHHSHTDDGTQWYPDFDDEDHDGDACEHFCHLHAIALVGYDSLRLLNQHSAFVPGCPATRHERATAPPTPPPNA